MKIVARFLLVLSVVSAVPISTMAEDADHAPDTYKVLFETSKGDFTVQVHREWAPNGADRFFKLVESGYYDECRFFRVVPGFMVQWGINGDPEIQKNWVKATIKDDRVTKSNTRGFITFATSGSNSRTSQLFINYGDNARLDGLGFSPFGQVTDGMDVVDAINAEYRERPDQGQIQERGNEYLEKSFPKLDYIRKVTVVKPQEPAEAKPGKNKEKSE
ncbi:MAG: peptidylprolyl isomerase [Planctomycetota bacterium]|nr:peptidylprolyl isomerase [Planctomycetota bacterium]